MNIWRFKPMWKLYDFIEIIKNGKKIERIANNHAVTTEQLLAMCNTFAKFATLTAITNIDKHLFVDKELEHPRLPYTLR